MAYLLGIDLGTSSVKCLLTDEKGYKISSKSIEYNVLVVQVGYAEQDPAMWWKSTVQCIAMLLKECQIASDEIISIGLTGQMHGTVLLEKNNNVLMNAIIHCDGRSQSEIEDIYKRLGKELFSINSYNPLFTGSQMASLMWIKHSHPELFDRIHKIILPKDYIRFMLTGEVGTEITDASGTLFYDIKKKCWSEFLLGALELEECKFASVHETYEIAGYISRSAAALTGLKEGTPVVFGAGDQPAQALGNGAIKPGIATSNIGTAGQIFTSTVTPVFNPQMNTNTFCHAPMNTWYIMGAVLSAGLSLKWYTDQIIQNNNYKHLDSMAEAIIPRTGSLIFLPYLCGERTPHLNPKAKGMFFGLTLEHTFVHMYRAAMEGVVFSLKDSISLLETLGVDINRIIASGGGANSSLWLQMQADIFNREIITTASNEQASLGAAIIAAVGCGLYKNLEEASDVMVRLGHAKAYPKKENVKVYAENYEKYKELYNRTADLY